ncbi:MAG TPA: 3-methyladenine DNA glycosylase [Kiritimatiellia bacterium]|nr:3-methyladenine DNA glycosylase [Kiritimatiellia bacterium]HMP32926.1 3-methyladenine DNA glycosylase [Kiritimatiellia bacterium]
MNAPVPACSPDRSGLLPAEGSILAEADWRARIDRHHAALDPLLGPHLDRAARGEKHPVMDFLFQYYPFAPAHLRRWTPGVGVTLAGDAVPGYDQLKEVSRTDAGWILDPARFPERRIDAARWVLALLEKTAVRAPRFGCFGLHEWAMVYRAGAVRHGQLPLRFSPEETARVVESLPVSCSHYDAFRFFTPEARPLNRLQPKLETRQDLEQCGCLHVNMDLYKWASQFYPWIASDLIGAAFLLACRIRELDMRASPYDLASMGLTPVCIETPEGRQEYVAWQQRFADEAKPLRHAMIEAFRRLLLAVTR